MSGAEWAQKEYDAQMPEPFGNARDKLAARAMEGLCANPQTPRAFPNAVDIAVMSYKIADAILKVRNGKA